jgi:cell division protein ZapA (FtsZ GTPase activity inhibitor)
MSRDIRVEIYGQTYSIRTDLDPDYIQGLAKSVDAKMNALSHQTGTVDTRRLAVLAALNLSDELQQLRKSAEAHRDALPSDAVRRLEECNRLLEAALGNSVQD